MGYERLPAEPRKYRRILPKQTAAQVADQARAQALEDPVQPAPVGTDRFQHVDFGGPFNNFSFPQQPVYSPFQAHSFQPLPDAMLSPHNVGPWGPTQAQASNWGGFPGRNGDGQLSAGASNGQMFGMGNAGKSNECASIARNTLTIFQYRMARWDSCLPCRPLRTSLSRS